MKSCFRTCRRCGDKDVTVSWRPDAASALCASCNIDLGREVAAEQAPLVAPLVTFSPAALRAMES